MPNPNSEKCATCKFFKPSEKQCWRYPPVFVDRNGYPNTSARPITSAENYCGEWKAIKD